MRNGRLGQVNALLNIGTTQPNVLANRTAALFLEGLQDPPPSRVGDSVENAIHFVLCHGSQQ
jgi:hypothetical protein